MLPSSIRPRTTRPRRGLLSATLALTLLGPGLALSAPAEARGATHVVSVGDGVFAPGSLSIAVGDTVTWTNDDDSPHTATAAGAFDSGNLEPGQSFSFTFDQPGTYGYLCVYHEEMTATITVVAASVASEPPASSTAAPSSAPAPAGDHRDGDHQPDTALPTPGVDVPSWLAAVLIGLGLVAFAVAVVPPRRLAPARQDQRGGWRR